MSRKSAKERISTWLQKLQEEETEDEDELANHRLQNWIQKIPKSSEVTFSLIINCRNNNILFHDIFLG